MNPDSRFMDQALRLAARGRGRTHPNPVVGCVVVRAGQVVGKGYHAKVGEPHAEVFALRQAGERARGATVYVTLEPCSHFGRTPPCVEGLIQAGVGRVVVAMRDPNLLAGGGVGRLRESGIDVTVGVREGDAQALNRPFVTWVTQGRPLVTLKMAASLDGKSATRTGESQWITGPTARRRVQQMRAAHDVVMVGIGTILADDPQLNCRMLGGRDPIRLVVDSCLRIPENAAVVTSSAQAPLWIAVVEDGHDERKGAILQRQGCEIITCRATAEGRVDLADLMMDLGRKNITSVMSESGGTLSGALFLAGFADRLALFLAPKIIGGQDAAGLLGGLGIEHLSEARHLVNRRITILGEDILLEGDLTGPCSPA